MDLWTETLPLIAWGLIFLGFGYVIFLNYQTGNLGKDSFTIRKYPKEAFEKVQWFWFLKKRQLKDLTYISIGGFEQTRGDGRIMRKLIQNTLHDKYGRAYQLNSWEIKYDENGEEISRTGGSQKLEVGPLCMYNLKNVYESYLKAKKADMIFIKDGVPQI